MSNSAEGMHPVLITGGAGATGLVVAERLATAGYPIILGTRSQEKFDVAVEHFASQNLPEPKPFIANLRDPESTQNALDSLQMSDGQPLHFLSLAAEGIKDFRLSIGKAISPIRRTLKYGGQPNEEQMIDATGKIKALVLTNEVQQAGRQANFEGPRALSNMLAERGHLGSNSKIMTLSSSLSDSTIPDKPSDYQGPWFYYPTAFHTSVITTHPE